MENNIDSLKNKAYKEALKFEKFGFEEDVIYAKLEKQGIPMSLARKVAMNVIIERKKNSKEHRSDYKGIILIMTVLWLLASIAAYMVTGRVFVAIELLVFIVPIAILTHLMTTDK